MLFMASPTTTRITQINIHMSERVVEAEAYAFTKLAEHLRMRTDVQNIDVMILAGFCRNCLSKWCLAHMTWPRRAAVTHTLDLVQVSRRRTPLRGRDEL